MTVRSPAARMQDVLAAARALGLDFFPIRFEIVPFEIMTELAAYGLPIRARHWSYGKVYARQHLHGRMGFSKIFEIVINNDPAYAFLLDTNSDVENLLIAAHVAAHVDFFKHNVLFADSERNMVALAAHHARRFERYREHYGDERVEALMDAAFAIDRHIDPALGLTRRPYPGRRLRWRPAQASPFADLFGETPWSLQAEVEGDRLPPHPERDLLWFLIQYAPLADWERDVLAMIRREAYYFYPQHMTKLINEGWATYWHARVLQHYAGLTPAETIEYARLHASVVQPGPQAPVNPYYLGFMIFRHIEQEYGEEQLFRVREQDDDPSFIRTYLTKALLDALPWPHDTEHARGRRARGESDDDDLAAVHEALLWNHYHYGVPPIVVDEVLRGELRLRQLDLDVRGLDQPYAEQTLRYLHQLWKGPVCVETSRQGRRVRWRYDGAFHEETLS